MKRLMLQEITRFYLEPGDFNGLPLREFPGSLGISEAKSTKIIRALIEDGVGTLVFGDRHPNSHIRGFPDEPAQDILRRLSSSATVHTCIYPTRKHLERIVSSEDYTGRPYERELALGRAQLDFVAFDLSVLEYYRNDPRYAYSNSDISAWIATHAESKDMPETDRVILQTFGFCYDSDLNSAVAVYLRYFADLTPEHQQVWKAKQLAGSYTLHPDYYRSTILGKWGTKLPVFQAFTDELSLINQMSELMNRPPLFRRTFQENRPREFGFLVRPMLVEFNSFVLMLDKMMSDNINKLFFLDDVPGETEEPRGNSKVVVKPRGTVTMLEDWLSTMFIPDDPTPLNEAVKTFREVREMRQRPAHAIEPDRFDQQYFHRQRELAMRSYGAVRALRLALANHPAVRSAELDIGDLLFKGEIWTY